MVKARRVLHRSVVSQASHPGGRSGHPLYRLRPEAHLFEEHSGSEVLGHRTLLGGAITAGARRDRRAGFDAADELSMCWCRCW